jgi:hypothetical protein
MGTLIYPGRGDPQEHESETTGASVATPRQISWSRHGMTERVMVSVIRNVGETATQPMSLDEIFEAIRTGEPKLKPWITQIRNRYEAEKDITGDIEKAKKAIADMKANLPGVLFSGLFKERNNEALVEYSGLLVADLDSLGDKIGFVRDTLKAYPFVAFIMLSPSGDGLKVGFNVMRDPARHGDSFRAIQKFFRDEANLEIDLKCKDLARICFLTFDPDIWVRTEGNQIIEPLSPEPKPAPMPVENLDERQRIAVEILGQAIEFDTASHGLLICPGKHLHTARDGPRDCEINLDGAPTIYCFHQSCQPVLDGFNKLLRSRIGKAEFVPDHLGKPSSPNGQEPEEHEIPWIDLFTASRVTSAQLDTLEIKPRVKLLSNWLAEGDEGIVYAPRGEGKTWFAIGAAVAMSTAGTFGEFIAPSAVPVLYVDGEMPIDLFRERTRGILKGNNLLQIINHEILFDRTNRVLNLNNPNEQDALLEFCLRDNIKVVVLDNGSTLFGGLKENEADSWNPIQRWLLNFRRHHIAVILVLHAGRNGLIRGTSSREDPVAWVISITRSELSEVEQGCRFITRFTKQSRNTGGLIVPDYEWSFVMDEAGDITTECKVADSLAVFHSIVESGVTECGQIARLMNVEPYVVSRLAKKAIDQGWLEKRGRDYKLKGLNSPDEE